MHITLYYYDLRYNILYAASYTIGTRAVPYYNRGSGYCVTSPGLRESPIGTPTARESRNLCGHNDVPHVYERIIGVRIAVLL